MNTTTVTFYEFNVFEIDPIISDKLRATLDFYFRLVVHTIIQIFGMTTNVVNIVTFLKVGLDDSVTISFFALAISDFFYLFFIFAARVPKWIDLEYPWTTLPYILIFYNPLFLDISVLLIVFTAVQKSCCVAIPLLFKNIFTCKVVKVVIISIYVIMIGTYIPFLASGGFQYRFSAKGNATVLKYVYFKHRRQVYFYWRLLNKTVLPMIAQILVLICSIILTIKLKMSARFRQSATATNSSKSQNAKVGNNERRAIQAVSLVTIIFFICNMPECVMHIIVSLVYPKFRKGERFINLYYVLSDAQNTLFMLNASINIFIYLKYNSKYYKVFMSMMTCSRLLSKKDSKDQAYG